MSSLAGAGRGWSREPDPVAVALARWVPYLALGFAVLLAGTWWTLARGPGAPPPAPPPPASPQAPATSSASFCDACQACDCACELGDLCESCDAGGCDCVAVPPGALDHSLEGSAATRPRCEGGTGRRALASLGLLAPLLVLFLWRRRR
jgi:hypothetical protein